MMPAIASCGEPVFHPAPSSCSTTLCQQRNPLLPGVRLLTRSVERNRLDGRKRGLLVMRTTGRHRKLHRKGCRFMSNEKHNHLDTGKNEQSPTGGPKEVRARIKRLRSRGARVALPSVAAELVADIKPGQDLREVSSWCEGDWLPVVAYAEVEHGKRTQKLVSHIRIRYDPWNKVAGWQEDVVKTKEVTMVTAAGALGLIEPGIRGQVLLDTLKPVSPPPSSQFLQNPAGRRGGRRVDRVRLGTLPDAGP